MIPLNRFEISAYYCYGAKASYQHKFTRVYASGNKWFLDTTRNQTITSENNRKYGKQYNEMFHTTGALETTLPSRWLTYKPLVKGGILYLDAENSISRVRSYLDDDTYVDFESHSSYFLQKCLGALAESFPYNVIESDQEYESSKQYNPEMPLERREALRNILPSYYVSNLDWVPNWADVRSALLGYGSNRVINFGALVEAGFLSALPRMNSSKPFARGASFRMKINPEICLLDKDVREDNKVLTDFIAKTNINQQEFLEDLRASLPIYTSKESLVDSYNNNVLCIGLCYVKAVRGDQVLERYQKQDATL